MSWGISPNATEKEKIFAEYNDSLNGMNSAGGLSYRHYLAIYDIGRELADKEYNQGRADEIDEFLSKAKEKKYHSEITHENCVPIAELDWIAEELKEQLKEGAEE